MGPSFKNDRFQPSFVAKKKKRFFFFSNLQKKILEWEIAAILQNF